MDKELRNRLRATVVQCRKKLEAEVQRQLEGTYGILPSGKVLSEDGLGKQVSAGWRMDRERIAAAIQHIESYGLSRTQAMDQFVRESGFTVLNRLAALKLMEHSSRGLILESAGKGKDSGGLHLFRMVSPEACREEADGGYRLYLEMLFDDFSQEMGVLFDRSLPNAIVFPSETCLKEALDILNDPAIETVWGEDETIGWIYQYFTPKELRDESRKKHAAPQNSYELAFRNQFYTPRYVVQFLVDNTLGRLWYEMHQGNTRLRDDCRYLVRRPAEVFLPPGEKAEGGGQQAGGTSYPIPHRARKDPRDIRALDLASGSGHFLLYAYDLLTTMYEEAWEDAESPSFSETGRTLRQEYATLEELRRAVPALILQHNLYGIDIDLRATQIAALALWLRAQKSYQALGLKAGEPRRISRSNIVCAEPMPGEADLLREFIAQIQPAVLGQLVGVVVEKMKLAGEAGSLLKIEEEIKEAVASAKRQWQAGPKVDQLLLFPERERKKIEQLSLFDVSGISDEAFWEHAEGQVLDALRRYAARADNGKGYSRRLFAGDADQGFAFVDVCLKRFDVVLMNPPFGAASEASKTYIDQSYPRTKNDLYAAFVERGLAWLRARGLLGAITSRTGFFLSSFQTWREDILLGEARPIVMADLGQGVLDTAMVETAAYCLEKIG